MKSLNRSLYLLIWTQAFLWLVSCGGGGGGFGGGLIPAIHSFSIDARLPNTVVDLDEYLDGSTGPYTISIVSGPGSIDEITGEVVVDGLAGFDVIIIQVSDSVGNTIKVRVPVIGEPINWFNTKNITESPVSIWSDVGENKNNAVANCLVDECPSLLTNAINEQKAVSFDGINDRLHFQSNTIRNSSTVFIIFRTDHGETTGANWYESSALLSNYDGVIGHFDFGVSLNSAGEAYSGFRHSGGTTNIIGPGNWANDVGHLLTTERNQTTGTVAQYIDSAPKGTAVGVTSLLTDDPMVDFSIGAQNDGTHFYQGDIGEILIYGKTLTQDERQLVERYLRDKFDYSVNPAILPTITIDSVPADPTDNNVSFAFTAIPSNYFDIEKIECRLTGGSWQNCDGKTELDYFGEKIISDIVTYTTVPDGNYTFEIRVTDSDERQAQDSHAFIVDTSPPVCSITYPLNNSYIPLADPVATFSCIDANAITVTKCDIDDADLWNDCTTSTTQTFSGLVTDDVTKLELKAQDQYGQWSHIVSTIWTTDLEAPVCSFSSSPSGVQTDLFENFVYSCSDNNPFPGTIECSFDGGAFVSCGSDTNYSLTGLVAGNHTLTIRVVDVAGTVETQIASWTTDLAGPNCSFSGPVDEGGYSNEIAPTFDFICSDDNPISNHVQCNLDSLGASDCTTNLTDVLAGLSEGTHTLEISVTDIAGNPTSTTRNWSVDITNPSCSFDAQESGEVNNPLAHFEFTCSDPTSGGVSSAIDKVECSFDGGAYSDCDSHFMQDYIGLPDGDHTLRVRPIDSAGNIGSFIEANWKTAAEPPTISSNYSDATYPSSIFLELIPSKTTTIYYCISTVSTCDPTSGGSLYINPIETADLNATYNISYYGIDLTMQESITYSQDFEISRFELMDSTCGGNQPINGNNVRELDGSFNSSGFFRNSGSLGADFNKGTSANNQNEIILKYGFNELAH